MSQDPVTSGAVSECAVVPDHPDRVLIYGPPGAGKTTHARQLAAQGYTHHEREHYPDHTTFTLAVANDNNPHTVVVRCCFSPTELDQWTQLAKATRTILINPGEDECRRRVHHRNRHNPRGQMVGITRWFNAWGHKPAHSRQW